MNRRELAASVAVVLYIVFFSMPPPAIVTSVLSNIVGIAIAFVGAAYVTLYQSKVVGGLILLAIVLSVSRVGREGMEGGSCTLGPIKTSTVFDGGELANIPGVDSASQCGTKCCENASCTGYTYNSTPSFPPVKMCHLKSGTITEIAGPAIFSGGRVTRAAAPQNAYTPAAPWSATLRYSQGDTMTSGGKTYRAKLGNSNIAPSSPQFATYWEDTAGPAGPPSTMPPATTPTPGESTRTAPATTQPPPSASSTRGTLPPTESKVSPVMACNIESYSNYKRTGAEDFAAF